jgi:hypothetical protein
MRPACGSVQLYYSGIAVELQRLEPCAVWRRSSVLRFVTYDWRLVLREDLNMSQRFDEECHENEVPVDTVCQ